MTIPVRNWNSPYSNRASGRSVRDGAPIPLPAGLSADGTVDEWLVETIRLLDVAGIDEEGIGYQWGIVPRYVFLRQRNRSPRLQDAYSELTGQLRIRRAIASLQLQ